MDDYDDNCIICSFDKSWYHTHNCPPGYYDCGWGCDIDYDCSAQRAHDADSEQYSSAGRVLAQTCRTTATTTTEGTTTTTETTTTTGTTSAMMTMPGSGASRLHDLEGQWSCWDSSTPSSPTRLPTPPRRGRTTDEWPPRSRKSTGTDRRLPRAGRSSRLMAVQQQLRRSESDHTPVCREDAWAGCPTGQWWPNNRNT